MNIFVSRIARRLIGAALISLVLLGCSKKEVAPAPEVIRPVKIITLGGSQMERLIELPGQIKAFREASMGFEVPGLLQEVLVDEGDDVKKGDLLARLDNRDYLAARDSAEAQLTAARSEAERSQALFDRQATSKQRLDVALAQLQVARSAYDRADKALQDTELRAPLDGSVAKVFVEDIVNVQAKEPIMIVHDLSRFKVIIDVPETLAVLVDPTIPDEVQNERFKSKVFMTTGSDEGFPAKVIETSKTANPTTRTFSVTLVFDPPETLNVLPGMTARLRADATALVSPETSRFDIPTYAIGGQTDGQPYLWKVDPDNMTVSKVTVQTGRVMGNEIEVMAGDLQLGDLVAVSGILHLREGMQITEFEL